MQIKDYLHDKNLYLPLGDKSSAMDDAWWKVLDSKGMSAVHLSASRNISFHMTNETSTKGILKVLKDMFEKPSAVNKVHMMRRLFNLKMSESSTVIEHLNNFNLITVQLSSVQINFDDEMRALIIFSSLSESSSGTITSVSALAGRRS